MSRYILGMHDENPLSYRGWVVRVEQIGHDPYHTGGTDYRNSPNTVIARFQNEWYPGGTIPLPDFYDDFAKRAENFVENSHGCNIWLIGNEMNHGAEMPWGQRITPELYAQCYAKCWQRIHDLSGHEDDQVLVGATAPYNNQTAYPGNESGDWVFYHRDVLLACKNSLAPLGGTVDGFTLHAYTRDQNPANVISSAKMGPPFEHRSSGFQVYREFMEVVPDEMWPMAAYLTETNPGANGDPWQDVDTGWINAVMDEIAGWNGYTYGKDIRAVVFYCWDRRGDGMWMQDKPNLLRDFQRAEARGITWDDEDLPPPVIPDPDEDLAALALRVDALETNVEQLRNVVQVLELRIEEAGAIMAGDD